MNYYSPAPKAQEESLEAPKEKSGTQPFERYFSDKANIYRFQESGDILVVSEQVAQYIEKFGPEPKAKVIVARALDVPDSWEVKLLGEHNRLNIALALATARALGIPERTIQRAVERFKAIPGRLEHIRTFEGIEIYNDTNATTPTATIAALVALGKIKNPHFVSDGASPRNEKVNIKTGGTHLDKKIVLICAGADKKLDPAELIKILPEYVKALVILPGTGTDLMKEKLLALGKKIPVNFVRDMPEAVEIAITESKKGDKILMSPAFASFGLFKNEYDRGDQFNECVKNAK